MTKRYRVTMIFERARDWPPEVGTEIRMYWGQSVSDGYAIATITAVGEVKGVTGEQQGQ